jgi:hypothetical protein
VGSRTGAAQAVRARFAEATALLVLLGRPKDPNLVQALSRGLGVDLPAEPSADELFIAAHRAFELLDAKARAERAANGCRATATSSASSSTSRAR